MILSARVLIKDDGSLDYHGEPFTAELSFDEPIVTQLDVLSKVNAELAEAVRKLNDQFVADGTADKLVNRAQRSLCP